MRSGSRMVGSALAGAMFAGLIGVVLFAPASQACTTVLATPGATTDGSSMAAHSNDGEGTCDPRLVMVPAADHEEGSMREVHFAFEEYPRYVDMSRGVKEYFPTGNESARKPIGFIPQVPHTFAYFEETYGVINEKQVGIAESTCSGIFGAKPATQGGYALMSVDTLSQLAMERATTAREAVQLMGAMAEKYGFYGAGSFEGTAESLLVVDPHEGWVFHVLPDPTGKSAIWVAQRVPDGHVTVVPNIFIIRNVDLNDLEMFLGSKNMYSIAQEKGLWKPGTPFDFTAIYSEGGPHSAIALRAPYQILEYVHQYYSGRRLWRAFSLLAPSQKFPEEYDDLRHQAVYPFSVAPESKVSLQLVMVVMKDSMEGTKYDLTKGVAAGPFGTPDRWNPGKGEQQVKGAWERPIALFRTSDSYVVQARSWLPDAIGGLVWFGPHGAHGTCYVPFPIGMLALPTAYTQGDPRKLNRKSAYWAHRYVENLANLRWRDMIQDVRSQANTLEQRSWKLVQEMGSLLAGEHAHSAQNPRTRDPHARGNGALAALSLEKRHVLTDAFIKNAQDVLARWWELPDFLMEKYADGNLRGNAVGYPAWWLEQVGYPDGPTPIPGGRHVSYPPPAPGFEEGGVVS